MAILITGGAGYIGSHTLIEVLEQCSEDVISIDNYLNSSEKTYKRIEKISGKTVKHYNLDLTDINKLQEFFNQHHINGIIHFAALKSVPESVEKPLDYYSNNLNSLLNILNCCEAHQVKNFIFSSSCSVYGNTQTLPVTEDTPMGDAESPYAASKQMGERILKDFSKSHPDFKAISLRYFNPVGAHTSGLIGEQAFEKPNNLVPIITQTAIGIRDHLEIFGKDYQTEDGTPVRDYIHVSDIANAHVLALDYLKKKNTTKSDNYFVFNLGTGNGTSVLNVIKAFEKITGIKLNYVLTEKRKGDVEAIYANNAKAKVELGWIPKYSLEDMMSSAWKWQMQLSQIQ